MSDTSPGLEQTLLVGLGSHEATERANLLQAVEVDGQGVAICSNRVSSAIMRLAAVRVSDSSEATLVPLEQAGRRVNLALPAHTPSKIGFFMDYQGPRRLAAVVRLGDYPGHPLTTAVHSGARQELLINMAGIKPTELDEQAWADQMGLYEGLGFDPTRSRGVFAKSHQPSPESDWKAQRIVVVPQSMDDLVEVTDHSAHSFQVLGYEATEQAPQIVAPPPSTFDDGCGTYDALRIGFGSSYRVPVRTNRINLLGLQTAFEVSIVPES